MKPWYRGFTGDVEEMAPGRFKLSGRVTQIDEKTYEITELPIRVWTTPYKESLEERITSTDKVQPPSKTTKSITPSLTFTSLSSSPPRPS